MRVLIYSIMFSLCLSVYGQDPGEPVLTCDVNQDFQIKWRGETDWTIIVPIELVYSAGPVGSHRWVTWPHSNLDEMWEGEMPDQSMKMQATLSIPVPEGSGWWTYYEFRWRCRVYAGTSDERVSPWSECNRVYVITFGIPRKPVAWSQ